MSAASRCPWCRGQSAVQDWHGGQGHRYCTHQTCDVRSFRDGTDGFSESVGTWHPPSPSRRPT